MTIIDELRLWSDQSGSLLGDAAADEIERLTAELRRWQLDAKAYANVELSEENDRLIAEHDRLRAALAEIERQAPEYSDFYWAGDIARRALEGK